jgi:hypothetical protein
MCNLYSVTTNQDAMRRIFRFDSPDLLARRQRSSIHAGA